MADLAEFYVGVLSRIGIGRRQQIPIDERRNCSSAVQIALSGKWIMRSRASQASTSGRGSRKHVELQELDPGLFSAILDDEVVNDIRADISETAGHCTCRIQLKSPHGASSNELRAWRRAKSASSTLIDGRSFQLRTPAAAALVIVPPVLLEDIGENFLGIAGAEAVQRHCFIDHGAQPARRIVADRRYSRGVRCLNSNAVSVTALESRMPHSCSTSPCDVRVAFDQRANAEKYLEGLYVLNLAKPRPVHDDAETQINFSA